MKKVFATLFAGLMVSAQVMAVSVKDVCGQFNGLLNIAGFNYPDKSVYLLPGSENNTVTFVLPDFKYGAGKLGNIVLPNIPMDANGQLTLENSTLYLDSISERATITILNGLEDQGQIYNSIVTDEGAMVILSIGAPSLPEAILVLFVGEKATGLNCALPNAGFEGAWTNEEPFGWHSFGTAAGPMADFVKSNTKQMVKSTDIRPGSKGEHSVLLSSTFLLGVKANGNCTNGQINAGSSNAADGTKNYNFSDPSNPGFNTPFHGRPDSLVFWSRYVPADKDPSNADNKARAHAIITTDTRYQDPDPKDQFEAARIGDAEINFAATSDMGWQRLAVPFAYSSAKADAVPAYILTTFTTNAEPGGGSSYTVIENQNKWYVLDSVYVDDVEVVYNKQLNAFYISDEALTFENHVASVGDTYCDDCEIFKALAQGVSTLSFIAFDPDHRCIYIYVIADDFAQSKAYNIYRVEFADSRTEDINPISGTEDLETLTVQPMSCRKQLYNGQIIIIHEDGTVFDILGRKIR